MLLELIGAALLLAGLAFGILAVWPVRMRIETRSTRMAIMILLLVAGTGTLARATDANNTGSVPALLFMAIVGVGLAGFAKSALEWRWRKNRIDWERKWRFVTPPGILTDIMKRYLDID